MMKRHSLSVAALAIAAMGLLATPLAAQSPEAAAATPAASPVAPPPPPGLPNPHGHVGEPAAPQLSPDAALKFESMHKDFGEIREGETVTVTFPFENKSSRTVRITAVQPSCGCTTANDNPTEVAAGGKAEIKLNFNSSNRPGESFKAATITTDDPAQPTYRLTFQGKVTMDFEVKERMVDFGEVEAGQGAKKRFTILSTAPTHPTITEVVADDKRVQVAKVEEKDVTEGKPGREFVYEVTLPADFPATDLFTQVKIRSSHATKPEVSVPVRARVLGEFTLQPSQVFALMAKGETVERPVILTARKAASFTIEKIEASEALTGATFRSEDMPQPSMKKVIGSFVGGDAQGRQDGSITVTVKTDDGRLVPVTVPVVTMTRPAAPTRAQMLPNKAPDAAAPASTDPAAPAAAPQAPAERLGVRQ